MFTRPPTLSPSPAPSSKKLPGNVLVITSPHGLGAGSGRSPPPPAPAVPRARSLAGASAPQSSESSAWVRRSAARRGLRSPPRRATVPHARAFARLTMKVLGGRCGALLACLALLFPVSETNCEYSTASCPLSPAMPAELLAL